MGVVEEDRLVRQQVDERAGLNALTNQPEGQPGPPHSPSSCIRDGIEIVQPQAVGDAEAFGGNREQ